MDTSNLPHEHSCYMSSRKKYLVFSLTKQIDVQWPNLSHNKEKNYNNTHLWVYCKNHKTFKDYVECTFTYDKEEFKFDPFRENISIRSYNHEKWMMKSNKLCFNRQDDKRVIQYDRINTYAYGHRTQLMDTKEWLVFLVNIFILFLCVSNLWIFSVIYFVFGYYKNYNLCSNTKQKTNTNTIHCLKYNCRRINYALYTYYILYKVYKEQF
jgi:hypothetical protein